MLLDRQGTARRSPWGVSAGESSLTTNLHQRESIMEHNPYAAPTSTTLVAPAEESDPGEIRPSSQITRFLNMVIDNVVLQVLSFGLNFGFGMAYASMRSNPRAPITPDEVSLVQIVGFILGLVIAIGYYVVCEAIWQRTPAKFVTGTRVVTASGGKPSLRQIVGRTFARFIPFEALSFFGGKGYPVGWHDSLSGTRVIKVR